MTLNEKYVNDYNNKFARKVIVDDDCLDMVLIGPHACSYKQINDWTQQWMAENGDVPIDDRNLSIKVKTTFNL